MQNKLVDMYILMTAFYELNLPIVFKGALTLNAYLENNLNRETNDIDASFAQACTQDELSACINSVVIYVERYGLILDWSILREFSDKRSSKYSFSIRGVREVYFTLDISMRNLGNSLTYFFGDFKFIGVSSETMLGDKISAVSTQMILRRVKDLYDIYVFTFTERFTYKGLKNYILQSRVLGNFEVFRLRARGKTGIEYAYNKLSNITDKPDFDIVYARVYSFLQIFFDGVSEHDFYWNPSDGCWVAKI